MLRITAIVLFVIALIPALSFGIFVGIYEFGDCEGGLKGPAACDHISDALGTQAFRLSLISAAGSVFVSAPLAIIAGILYVIHRIRLRRKPVSPEPSVFD